MKLISDIHHVSCTAEKVSSVRDQWTCDGRGIYFDSAASKLTCYINYYVPGHLQGQWVKGQEILRTL